VSKRRGGGGEDLEHGIEILGFVVVFVCVGVCLGKILGQQVIKFGSIGAVLFFYDFNKHTAQDSAFEEQPESIPTLVKRFRFVDCGKGLRARRRIQRGSRFLDGNASFFLGLGGSDDILFWGFRENILLGDFAAVKVLDD